jgi:hypothetical protein
MQFVEFCLFDDDKDDNSENDPEHQLSSLFSSETFMNELVNIIGEQAINVFKSYCTGHVPAAMWMMHPPCSWHPGPSSTSSLIDKLTLIDRNQVDCGV